MEIPVNFFAILIAAITNMAIGFAWYSPALFGRSWMKIMGHTPEKLKKLQEKMGPLYALSFIGALLMAYILSHVIQFSASFFQGEYDIVSTGLMSAFWMWLGFVAPVQMTDVIFGNRPWKLFYINTGYQFISMLAMGLILSIMGV